MTIKRRIYFSLPQTTWEDDNEIGLTEKHYCLIQRLKEKIEELHYEIEVCDRIGNDDNAKSYDWNYEFHKGMNSSQGDKYTPTAVSESFNDVHEVIRRCSGTVIIGLPRWILNTKRFGTEYSHYEGAVARMLGLPCLVLVEKSLMPRVIFDSRYSNSKDSFMAWLPHDADESWLESPHFQDVFTRWQCQLEARRDLFLGYSSGHAATAKLVKSYLKDLGVSVLDWHDDFPASSFILEQIQDAARRCSGGIFLFTKDDKLARKAEHGGIAQIARIAFWSVKNLRSTQHSAERPEQAVPRDNVIFEAGYFIAAKGKERVLIICEKGSKMPADLGGDIFLPLADCRNIEHIKLQICQFLAQNL